MNQLNFFEPMNDKRPAPSRPLFTITPAPAQDRTPPHYYRCPECLSVICTRAKLPPVESAKWNSKVAAAFCACGNAHVEYLGQAGKNERLQEPGKACPCDERCTGARGPNCECPCGGKNHGTNLLVDVMLDRGPIPVLKMKSELTAKGARSEWMNAQLAAKARMERPHGPGTIAAYLRREYPAGTMKIREQFAALAAAKEMRSQKGRLAALAKIAPTYTA